MSALGITTLDQVDAGACAGFVTARTRDGQIPAVATQHARRVALRLFFRTVRHLGGPFTDPTLDLVLPVRDRKPARPLTDEEVHLCRAATRLGHAGARSLQRAVAWALGEATGVSSEISAIRIGDLDSVTHPRWVHLPGTTRHDPRLGELTDWGAAIVRRQAELLADLAPGPETLLTYRGSGTPGQHTAQAAVCNALGSVLTAAGVNADPAVRPGSVRAWAGRRLYDDGMPIEQVARRLGSRTLDTAAAEIAMTWRTA